MAHHHDPKKVRREYWSIFVLLGVLTAIEVGVAKVPGIGRALVISALVLLAISKAGIVGLFYMHLKHETKIMQWSIAIPLLTPGLYAIVLMAEASWRLVIG